MGLNILIVDDVQTNILYLESLLEEMECSKDLNILTAMNAKDAIDICLNNDIILILSDVDMPEMSGIEMAQALKSNPITDEIPVIFITAQEQTDEFIQSTYKLGAVDFFTKPLDRHTLLPKIRLYLNLFSTKTELNEYRKVIDNSVIALKFDLDGNIIYSNALMEKVSGYTWEEILDYPFTMLTATNVNKKDYEDAFKEVQSSGYWEGIIEKTAKNGDSYFVKESISAILNTRGEAIEYMSIAEDITELKRLQLEELDRSVHKALDIHWEKLTEAIPIPTVIVNNDSEILYHNDLFNEFSPVGKCDPLGQCFIDDENYIYNNSPLDWKDVALNYEGQAKVLINDSGENKEYYLDIKKIDNEELYIVCLHYVEKEV